MKQEQIYSGCKFWSRAKLLCLLLPVSFLLPAQDIHFTQFFSNPLLLNPAQTGYFQGNIRVGFNFKAQWPWAIASPGTYTYQTESPYVDLSFGEKKIKSGWMGIGLGFMNDEAGDGILTYRQLILSYAYHQAFDKNQRYILSAGVVANYVVRSVDFSKLYFNDQWVQDFGFNTTIDPREPYLRESYGLFDLGAGLNFGAQISKRVKLDVGYCMLHINEPEGGFYNDNTKLGLRYQATAGLNYKISNRVSFDVNGYFGYEKTANEALASAMVRYSVSHFKSSEEDATAVYLGACYRINDAIAPLVGLEIKHIRLILSYDITISQLLPASVANGGPELSLVYVAGWEREFNGKKVYCPRF